MRGAFRLVRMLAGIATAVDNADRRLPRMIDDADFPALSRGRSSTRPTRLGIRPGLRPFLRLNLRKRVFCNAS